MAAALEPGFEPERTGFRGCADVGWWTVGRRTRQRCRRSDTGVSKTSRCKPVEDPRFNSTVLRDASRVTG